ncbi:MAG TPA: VOC family protein [Polyangia bacterium]|nr:VOC family protein [Polyangia bacterium]
MTAALRFDWHELQTRDCARALRFYQAFCGWTTSDASAGSPRERHLCSRDGVALGAITVSQAPPHVPAFWLPFLALADLDGTLAAARKLGARVLREPALVPGAGRLAVAVDPQGAVFGLRDAGATAPADPAPGSFSWDELLTNDAESAATFYAALTGCSIEAMDLGPMGTYRILVDGGRRIAGVVKHPENAHPHWLPYLSVRDVDTETSRAVDLGASLYFAPRDVPGAGRIGGIDDPTGAGVCLITGGQEV